jgi:hypothetical protein
MQCDQVKRRIEFRGSFKESNLPIAFSLFKPISQNHCVELRKYSNEELQKVLINRSYVGKREVTERLLLAPGFYIIIPSTYERNTNLNYLIRIFMKIVS